MKKSILLLTLLALFALPLSAQYAYRIKPLPALPATCNPLNGEVVTLTSGTGSPGVFSCTGTNTWSPIGYSGINKQDIISQGTLTGSFPYTNHTVTWNNGGVIFVDYFVNITNTASAAGSLLGEWQVGGTDVFNLQPSGRIGFGPYGVTAPGITPSAAVAGKTQGIIITRADGTTAVFADLGAATNGSMIYCSDCAIGAACAGAGTGAIAKRLNNAWVCN